MRTEQHGFASWMGSMWLYTVLRFGLFFVLWGVLVWLGVTGLLAALIAIVLSVPLSFVLLAKPRARFAAQLEQRVNAAREARTKLDDDLSGDD
jgi:O-antigen ligase